MRISTLFLSMILLIISAYFTITRAEQREFWKIDNWSGTILTDRKGNFERCTASISYTDNATLSFGIDQDGLVTLRVTNLDWPLISGKSEVVEFTANGQSYSLTGNVSRHNVLVFQILDGDSFLEVIKAAYDIEMTSQFGTYALGMASSRKALDEMDDCATQIAIAIDNSSPVSQPVQIRTGRIGYSYAIYLHSSNSDRIRHSIQMLH